MEVTTSKIQQEINKSSIRPNAFNVELSKYEAKDSSERINNKGWVDYGVDNQYAQYLLELYKTSPVHNAICNKVAKLVYDKGLAGSTLTQKFIDELKINDNLLMLCSDFYLQGGCYAEVIPSNDKRTPAEINYLPFEKCRLAVDDNDQVIGVYFSHDWQNIRKQRNIPKFLPFFEYKNDFDEESYVRYKFMHTIGSEYYPKPPYIGALYYIEISTQIGMFHLNNIMNGFFPSIIAQFNNGQPDPEKAHAVVRDMERNLSGAKNAGKMVVLFNDDKDNAATFETFPLTDADKQYELVQNTAKEMIFVGHGVTSPLMFGIRDGGGLGNNANELTESVKEYKETVIMPYQSAIESLFNDIFADFGIVTDFSFNYVDTSAELDVPSDAATQSYNGAQISSAIQIVQSVKEGILTQEQAVVFLIQFLNLPPNIAESFFVDTQEAILSQKKKFNLSKTVCCSKHNEDKLTEELEKKVIEYCKEKAEDIDLNEWELVDEQAAHDEVESELSALEAWEKGQISMSLGSYAKPNETSKEGDSGLYKVRYAYSQNLSEDSREFCKEMVALSKAGKVFRFEDIKEMSDKGVNGSFAPQGQTTYDIFTWKGGVYCHHFFKRQIYFRKREGGKFLPNDGLKNDKRVGNNPYVKQKGQEAIAPINTPTRGSLKNFR